MTNPLLREVISSCGLPEEMISKELEQIMVSCGYEESSLTMEQLRNMMAVYMQSVLLDLKDVYGEKKGA